MKADKLFIELEQLIESIGYTVRKERGTFQGDSCVFEGDQLVMINRKKPVEQQVGLLARVLKTMDLQDRYIKPAVRKELNELWQRMDTPGNSETATSENPEL